MHAVYANIVHCLREVQTCCALGLCSALASITHAAHLRWSHAAVLAVIKDHGDPQFRMHGELANSREQQQRIIPKQPLVQVASPAHGVWEFIPELHDLLMFGLLEIASIKSE